MIRSVFLIASGVCIGVGAGSVMIGAGVVFFGVFIAQMMIDVVDG